MEYIYEGAGWLSPTGNFYPCKYSEHYNTAYNLITELLHYDEDEIKRADDMLEKLGWVRIGETGDITSIIRVSLTQAQINLIGDMILLNGASERWIENMKHNLEYAEI